MPFLLPIRESILRSAIAFKIFLLIWAISISGIRHEDLNLYHIQWQMVKMMAENKSFVLGQLNPSAPHPPGDIIVWEGNILPFKQPGIAVVGSIPLLVYQFLGEENNNIYKYAITTAWTSAISNALISVLIFLSLPKMRFLNLSAAFAAIISGTSSVLAAYSGTLHHDTIAAFFVFLGFYLLCFSKFKKRSLTFFISGLLFGLTLFVSLLPIAIIFVLLLWGLLNSYNKQNSLALFAGFFLGLAPILLYQFYFFGSPILTASNIYSLIHGTKIFAAPNIMLERLIAYFNPFGRVNLIVFMPICLIGFFGLLISRKTLSNNLKVLLLLTITAHGIFLILVGGGNTCSQYGFGDCQYGPRYWICSVPFMSMGIASVLEYPYSRRIKFLVYPILFFIFCWSLWVNQLGHFLGIDYCGGTLITQFEDYLRIARFSTSWKPLLLEWVIFLSIIFVVTISLPILRYLLPSLKKHQT